MMDVLMIQKLRHIQHIFFGNGAVALGNGNPEGFVPTETDRAKRKGSGVDYLINRRTTILHPRGIAFTNANVAKTEGPSKSRTCRSG